MVGKVIKSTHLLLLLMILALVPVVALAQQQGITNPLGNIGTVSDLLGKIINYMLGLVGFIALIALITGGARMIMDFGNEEQVKKGKMTIMWAVIGLLVVLLSYAIINIVTGEILGGNTPTSFHFISPAFAADANTFQGGLDEVKKLADT